MAKTALMFPLVFMLLALTMNVPSSARSEKVCLRKLERFVHGAFNLTLCPGSQAVANPPALAMVHVNSYWVQGFFRETMVGRIDSYAAAGRSLVDSSSESHAHRGRHGSGGPPR